VGCDAGRDPDGVGRVPTHTDPPPLDLLRGRMLLMLVVNFTLNWGYWGPQT
jgi:hypothetical protein